MALPDDPVAAIELSVAAGRYRVGWHAVQHMFEEGFAQSRLLEALAGKLTVLEEYEDEDRALVWGHFRIGTTQCPLHIVCDFGRAGVVEFVTAYIPVRPHWINPHQRG